MKTTMTSRERVCAALVKGIDAVFSIEYEYN